MGVLAKQTSRMVIIDPSAVSMVNAMEMYMDVVLELNKHGLCSLVGKCSI